MLGNTVPFKGLYWKLLLLQWAMPWASIEYKKNGRVFCAVSNLAPGWLDAYAKFPHALDSQRYVIMEAVPNAFLNPEADRADGPRASGEAGIDARDVG